MAMSFEPTRRQFAKAAVAAIASSQFPILGANDRVNVGIAGLGGQIPLQAVTINRERWNRLERACQSTILRGGGLKNWTPRKSPVTLGGIVC